MKYIDQSQMILFSPIFFGIGIGGYFSLTEEPSLWLGLIAFTLTTTSLLLYYIRYKEIPFTIISVLLIVSGFCIAQFRTISIQEPILQKTTGPVKISGTIEDLEWLEKKNSARIILKHLKIEDLSQEKTPYKIRIKLYDGSTLKPGQKISLLGKLNPPGEPVSPYAFDFQRYAYFKQIGAVGFAFGKPEIIEDKNETILFPPIVTIRYQLTKIIKNTLSGEEQSLALALITGQRNSIHEETWEHMRSAGLAHMLAISGLHVGMVAGILFFFFRFVMACIPKLALKYPIKKYAAGLALLGAFLYMLLVGAPITTQRAMLMTGMALIAIILDRSPFSLRLVALSALVILTFFPESLLSAGFQMSFAAVTALISFYDALRPYWSRWYKESGWLRKTSLYILGICCTTIIASIATAPFSIYHFQHFAPYGLLGNILAVPIMGFLVMPCAVFFLLLSSIPSLAILPLKIMGTGISAILIIAKQVSSLSGASLLVAAYPFYAFILVILSGLLLCTIKGSWRSTALIPLILSIPFFFITKEADIKISYDGKLIQITDQNDHAYVSSRVQARFSRESWARMQGIDDEFFKAFPKEGHKDTLFCSDNQCRFEKNGFNISIINKAYHAFEECQWADLLIAKTPLPKSTKKHCKAAVILDKFDFWRQGAYDIYLEKYGNIKVVSTKDVRGSRPWTPD